MNLNEHTVDRVVRIILGLALIWFGFFQMMGGWGLVVGFVGFIPLITGAIGWCPLYSVFKINTRGNS
ncbi:MAG: DUF2892 domain-containing protein [Chloroflexi bacterium]|nr:MAG: DUF2892 domain-containing protein [Chloroflexota bacterium]